MNRTQGMKFTTILFLVFLVLKLTNVISWSWWWVTAPLWAGFAISIIIFAIPAIITVLGVFALAIAGLFSKKE